MPPETGEVRTHQRKGNVAEQGMRIVFLSVLSLPYASFIGRTLPLARALIRAGHQVRILTLHHDWPGRTFVEQVGEVSIEYVGPMHVRGLGDTRRQLAGGELLRVATVATVQMVRHALAAPADIYHVWKPLPFNGLAGLLAARVHQKPLLVDCDDYEAQSSRFTGAWQRSVVRWFEDTLPRLSTRVTVNTHFTVERLCALGIPDSQVVYIPNGVDPERFAPPDPSLLLGLRHHLGLEGKKVVVYVGILSLVGHPLDLLLQAFAQVAQACPQAHLLWVGGGEDGARLRQWTEEMGLADRVTFVGLVSPEKAGFYYRLGDCSVDPVRDDAHARARCPLKILESMACGVPVVTGDVGDRRQLLADGQAGVLVAPGRSDALAEGIRMLLDDEKKRKQMGEAGQQQVEQYRWDYLARHFISLYQALRKQGPSEQ